MNKRTSVILSSVLILAGLLLLASNVAGAFFGFRVWQLWPLIVVAVGWAFVLPPLLVRDKRGLGGLFIPGLPVLATGTILLLASIFPRWNVWAWLWPWEVIGVALGFLFAALSMKVIWLLIPAIILGANGVLFQFCTITGWWEVWSLLWVIEPLSVGLALLLINTQRPSRGLRTAGIVLCAWAAFGFLESVVVVLLSSLMPMGWLWRWNGPLTLILIGAALLIWGTKRTSSAPELVAE